MALSLKYHISASQFIFYSLVLWSIIGFYSELENTTQYGCIIDDYVFSFRNIAFSSLSLALLFRGFFSHPQRTGLIFIAGEFIFWLYKLLFLKGGYVVGIAGTTPENIVLYDFVALTLRLLLLKHFLALPVNKLYVPVVAVVIMVLKVVFLK
jgi:hypothetical protein